MTRNEDSRINASLDVRKLDRAIAKRYPELSTSERQKVMKAFEKGIAQAIAKGGYAAVFEPGPDGTAEVSLFLVEDILGLALADGKL